ncbi:MAG: hypothetical protein Q8Q04_03655 [archaeon]|nr:hypothetical protein [archaeon]
MAPSEEYYQTKKDELKRLGYHLIQTSSNNYEYSICSNTKEVEIPQGKNDSELEELLGEVLDKINNLQFH